jgi:hypothetical protein
VNELKYRILGFAIGGTLALAGAVPAFANGAGGDYCGASANGCAHAAAAGAQCDTGAGSGAFGAFGKDKNFAGGADGIQTGLNNSALCGNRQGNLP